MKFSSIGDVVLSTAAIRAIKEKFLSTHKITFLVGEEAKEILLRCPFIDELMVCDFKNRDKGFKGLWQLAFRLRKGNFDTVIDLQNNRKSHLLSCLSLIPQRIGYDNKKLGFLLNRRIKDDKAPLDPVTHQFRVLKISGIELNNPHLELWPTEEDQRYADELLNREWLSPKQKIVGINISASPRWVTKTWPLEYLVKLCEELTRQDMRIVLTGTENDLTQVNALIGSLKNVKPINACGKTNINQLACLIKRCSVYISTDSAPLHVAAAMDTPFIALFGPTDPKRHLPLAKNSTVISKNLSCSPCYKSKCKTKKCMNLITVEEVLEAIDKLLK